MTTLKHAQTFFLFILITASTSVFAVDGPTKAAAKSLKQVGIEISDLLAVEDVAGVAQEGDEVEITFSLDQQGRIIILDVDGYNPDLNKLVKKTLQNEFIEVDIALSDKIYKLPIEINLK